MDFEKWLNKADKEISKRKEKDIKKEGKISKDYDNRIHQLYVAYQTHKNSKLMLIVTIILVIATGFYTYQTYRLNEITSNQFISENSPVFYIESLGEVKTNGKEILFDITLKNIGKSPRKNCKHFNKNRLRM
jgi:hypothetical protein